MALPILHLTSGKKITINWSGVIAFLEVSPEVTRIYIDNVSHDLAMTIADFALIMDDLSPYGFTQFSDIVGRDIRIRLDTNNSFEENNATSIIAVFRDISFALNITYANFEIAMGGSTDFSIVAASSIALKDFLNNGLSQVQNLSIVIDRKDLSAGDVTLTNLALPAGLTLDAPSKTALSEADVVNFVATYAGVGSGANTYNLQFDVIVNGKTQFTMSAPVIIV